MKGSVGVADPSAPPNPHIQEWDHTTSLVMMTIMIMMTIVAMMRRLQCSSPMARPRVGVATTHPLFHNEDKNLLMVNSKDCFWAYTERK